MKICISLDIKAVDDIKVKYDGSYPNACGGILRVIKAGNVIFETKEYSFRSTGSVSFTEEWEEIITPGILKWNDDDEYTRFLNFTNTHPNKYYILSEVETIMESIDVCCGGCV